MPCIPSLRGKRGGAFVSSKLGISSSIGRTPAIITDDIFFNGYIIAYTIIIVSTVWRKRGSLGTLQIRDIILNGENPCYLVVIVMAYSLVVIHTPVSYAIVMASDMSLKPVSLQSEATSDHLTVLLISIQRNTTSASL